MQRGFSLVELSIVLVILGLLTGGILAGQSLVRASELRSIGTQYQRYYTAGLTFRDKYFALPGDMANATAFWGVLAGTGSDQTCHNTPATGAPTCNGDGNGDLLNVIAGVTNRNNEFSRFWQHLANAGLIEGQYSGLATNPIVPGVMEPASKLSNAYFYMRTTPGYATEGGPTYYAGSTTTFAGDYGKAEILFTSVTATTATAGSCPLSPQEAWNIDTKLDDGLPGGGNIIALKGDSTNTNCTTFAGVAPPGDSGATYMLNNNSKDCALYFVRLF